MSSKVSLINLFSLVLHKVLLSTLHYLVYYSIFILSCVPDHIILLGIVETELSVVLASFHV